MRTSLFGFLYFWVWWEWEWYLLLTYLLTSFVLFSPAKIIVLLGSLLSCHLGPFKSSLLVISSFHVHLSKLKPGSLRGKRGVKRDLLQCAKCQTISSISTMSTLWLFFCIHFYHFSSMLLSFVKAHRTFFLSFDAGEKLCIHTFLLLVRTAARLLHYYLQ